MRTGQRPQGIPPSALTLAELAERAGNPSPKYAPIIIAADLTADGQYRVVKVSIAPANVVTYRVPAAHYDPATIAAVLSTSSSLFTPAGLTADLYAPE